MLYNTRFEDGGRYTCKTFMEDGRVIQNYVDLVIKRKYRRRRQHKKKDPERRRRNNHRN